MSYLAAVRSSSPPAAVSGPHAADAFEEARAIALDFRRRFSRAWIPRDEVWMLHDPCVTTRWKDALVAARFREFVAKRQEEEREEARGRRRSAYSRPICKMFVGVSNPPLLQGILPKT